MSSPAHSKSVASKTAEKTSQLKPIDKNQNQLNPSEKKVTMSHSTMSEKKSKTSDRKSNLDRGSQPRPRRTHWDRDGDTNPDRSISDGHGHHRRGSHSLQLNHASIEYENTYKMGPDARFSFYEVTKLVQKVLDEALTEVTYDTNRCQELSQSLVGQVLTAVKKLGVERYKFVVVVSLGSTGERPGTNFGSRCLWDPATDNFASATFNNESLFAVATVYAVYQE